MMKNSTLVVFTCLISLLNASTMCCAQDHFSRKDSLRGSLRTERNYDVLHYDLDIAVDVESQKIEGAVIMEFVPNQDLPAIQMDLFENMNIQHVLKGNRELKYRREYDAFFIESEFKKGDKEKIKIVYSGKPKKALKAPWDGGFVWQKDAQGKPWVGLACEGAGASLWWPNKDHLSDEPDRGMDIHITVDHELMAISNGQFIKTTDADKNHKTWHWHVSYPINNYNVSLYIGDFAHIQDQYMSADSSLLQLDYYVLKENEMKAKSHFGQVKNMLACYEKYFDKYPFWKDGYKLIEAPYLGMEHQSAIAYGNQYKRGYLGGLVPEEFDFDFIIIHESGHEYFGNAVSVNDHADMWIHEGFTTYMEALYVEYIYGKKAALRYLESQRKFIKNQLPVLGPRGVNFQGFTDSDHYYKGSWILQTLRFSLKNDSTWFKLIRGFYQQYKYRNIDTEDFIRYMEDKTHKNYTPFFNLYLKKTELPKVSLRTEINGERTRIFYKLECSESSFELPIELSLDGRVIQLDATTNEKNIEFNRVFKNVKAVNTQSLVRVD